MSTSQISYLSAKHAAQLDADLMDQSDDKTVIQGFSIDQLMELAGLSCAQAIHEVYTPNQSSQSNQPLNQSILVLVGPGNNGGDALVAARHLMHFAQSSNQSINRSITIVYPVKPKKELYQRLLAQVKQLGATIIGLPSDDQSTDQSTNELSSIDFASYDLIIDGIFGFSFDPTNGIREPYKSLIESMVKASNNQSSQKTPKIISIDIPSGWHVEDGDIAHIGLSPDMLISLTAPKPAAKKFVGRYHVIGGRFVPPSIREKYKLKLPKYDGTKQYILIDQSKQSPPQS
jgi:hydroxyethylthiazole kinase-like uncharacterized protein yjeF